MLRKAMFIAVSGMTLVCQFGCDGIHDYLIHGNQIVQLLGALSQLGIAIPLP